MEWQMARLKWNWNYSQGKDTIIEDNIENNIIDTAGESVSEVYIVLVKFSYKNLLIKLRELGYVRNISPFETSIECLMYQLENSSRSP